MRKDSWVMRIGDRQRVVVSRARLITSLLSVALLSLFFARQADAEVALPDEEGETGAPEEEESGEEAEAGEEDEAEEDEAEEDEAEEEEGTPGLAFLRIVPNSGPVAGNHSVKLRGTGFRRGMQLEIFFGEREALGLVVETTTRILVITPPARRAGPVNVRIRLGGQRSVTLVDAYMYEEVSTPDEGEGPDDEGEGTDTEGEGSDSEGEGTQPDGEQGQDPDEGGVPEGTEPVDGGAGGEGGEGDEGDEGDEVDEEVVDIEAPIIPDRFVEQYEADRSPVPRGQGAIFVPCLTDPTLEPAVDMFRDGALVESARCGQRVFLVPGRHLIRVGRGNDRVRPTALVEVTEGNVTFVLPTWGALVVDVVDEHNIPHRGTYDLIRVDTREPMGQGRGADRRSGEGIRTWLLSPGVYKIVQPGGTYRDRVDFATVRVNVNQAIDYTLVMDPGTGAFRGAGITAGSEPRTIGAVQLRGAIGGALQFQHRYNVIGEDEGIGFGGNFFIDFDMLYDRGWHYLSLQLQLEAGLLLTQESDWRKTLDFADFAAIYIFQIHSLIGPYARFSYNSHMIPSFAYPEEGSPIAVLYDVDGNEELTLPEDVPRIDLGPSFSRNDIREGIGANWRAVRSYYIDLDLRLGFGFQQLVNNDLVVREESLDTRDNPETDVDESTEAYQRREPFTHREGIDVGLVAAGSLTGWLSYDLEILLLEPFTDLRNPVFNVDLSITIRLFSFASLNYILRVNRDVAVSSEWQIDQAVLLRFAFTLF